MGCTSSAPNMPEIAANAAEKESTTENEKAIDVDVKEEYAVHEAVIKKDLTVESVSKVLPTCDNLEENINLASDSFTNIINEENENDNPLHGVLDNVEIQCQDQHEDNKFSNLKAVADQVLLNNIFEDIDQKTISYKETLDSDSKEDNTTTEIKEKSTEFIECSSQLKENEKEREITEESSSPSQSDGNRSTRWEALADIAAELPPSLTVDPVTGQIYSLTK